MAPLTLPEPNQNKFLDGKLFLIGGFVDQNISDLCNTYCLRDGNWKNIKHMGTPRMGHWVAVVKNNLYAIGAGGGKKLYCIQTV